MIVDAVIAEDDLAKVFEILPQHSTVGSLMEAEPLRHLSMDQLYKALHIIEDRERARRQDPFSHFRRK